MEPNRAQNADLLATLDHVSERDHADGRDTDDQSKGHERFQDAEEPRVFLLIVVQLLLDRDRLDAARKEHGLDVARRLGCLIGVGDLDQIAGVDLVAQDRCCGRVAGVDADEVRELRRNDPNDAHGLWCPVPIADLQFDRGEPLLVGFDAIEQLRQIRIVHSAGDETIDHGHARFAA